MPIGGDPPRVATVFSSCVKVEDEVVDDEVLGRDGGRTCRLMAGMVSGLMALNRSPVLIAAAKLPVTAVFTESDETAT